MPQFPLYFRQVNKKHGRMQGNLTFDCDLVREDHSNSRYRFNARAIFFFPYFHFIGYKNAYSRRCSLLDLLGIASFHGDLDQSRTGYIFTGNVLFTNCHQPTAVCTLVSQPVHLLAHVEKFPSIDASPTAVSRSLLVQR